jgi:hypothetical protein
LESSIIIGWFEIETKTDWEDSGYDCQLCGVKLYKRTDTEIGQPTKTCYQGEHGCQWALNGELIRVGSHPDCQKLQRQQRELEASPTVPIPNWVWGVVIVGFILLVLRFGGIVALRFLVPIALAGVTAFYLYRLGRERQWW